MSTVVENIVVSISTNNYNICFTETVAVSLNESGPFALRNSVMDDTEVVALSRACIFKIVRRSIAHI